VQLTLVGHALLRNQFARHVGQEVRAIQNLVFRNQADAAKNGALLVAYTGREALFIHIKVNVDASWGQAFVGPDAHHARITFDEGQLHQFGKVVHFCDQ